MWFPGFVRCIDAKVLGCAKVQSVVLSMEVVRFSEVAFTLSLCKLQSVPQGLSTVERKSASQRVRYGRLHCTCRHVQMYTYCTCMCSLQYRQVCTLVLYSVQCRCNILMKVLSKVVQIMCIHSPDYNAR